MRDQNRGNGGRGALANLVGSDAQTEPGRNGDGRQRAICEKMRK